MKNAEIILGIPGQWRSKEELIKSIVEKDDGYIFAERVLHNTKKNIVYQMETVEYDMDLKGAFRHAGEGQIGESVLEEISNHTMTVYIVANVQNYQGICDVIDTAMDILDIGGIAIKIETTGKAHTKEKWKRLAEAKDHFPIYSMFVSLVREEEGYSSFGMKTFGLPDVRVPKDLSSELAADSLNKFNLYQVFDRPYFRNDEKVTMQNGTPTYYIHIKEDERYDKNHPYHNPIGLIDLMKENK